MAYAYENHPRPQLTRDQWTDLCGEWQFVYDDQNCGLEQGWATRSDVFDKTIIVPFPPESRLSGIGDPSPHSIVWYRRTFQVAPHDAEQRLLLHFGAVDYEARVWINGHLVAQHSGGHTPFTADITQAVDREASEQVVVVRAVDYPTDLSLTRGKQDWEDAPHRIWYYRTTGIWQPVWLEQVPLTYITRLRWTPVLDRGLVEIQVHLNQQPTQPLQLDVQLSLHDVPLVQDSYTVERGELQRSVALESGRMVMSREQVLWSPDNPNLLDAVLTLRDGDRVIDRVYSYVGLRSAAISNGRFLLNGRPYYLRLVLEQGYWPESHLAAPSADALRREVELTKALGFNGVRIHQKVEDPRFLYWCDRLGLLVWGEMANAYVFSTNSVERLTREWLEVLQRDYNHPCIVTWVPINESWGVPALERDPAQRHFVRSIYHLTKSLDGTRPVIGNDGWEHLATDIWGIHDYALDGATLRERYSTFEQLELTITKTQPQYRTIALPDVHRKDEPVMITECGGISYTPASGERWYGYGTVDSDEAYLEKYADIIGAILDCPTIMGFCYTQLTDTEQEMNGLLREDRTPKLNPEAIRAINQRPSKALPAELLQTIRRKYEVSTFQTGG